MSKEFIEEVNQELHDEKLLNLWQKYKIFIITCISAIVLGTGGYSGYTSYQTSKFLNESLKFENAINGNYKALEALVATGGQGTQLLSAFTLASRLYQDGKTAKSKKVLLEYATMQNTDSVYGAYARLASVWVSLKKNNNAKLLPVVETVLKTNNFKVLALFTKVEILLSNNKKNEATAVLSQIALEKTASPNDKRLAEILLKEIGSK